MCGWDYLNWCCFIISPTHYVLRNSAGFRGRPKGLGPRAPTMFMCLAICATCACHLVAFSEKSLFVDAINYRSAKQQHFTWRKFDILTKQLLDILVSWKSVNLVIASPSHVEHVSLSLYSFLVDFVFALLTFA